jgi:hypothetical protein
MGCGICRSRIVRLRLIVDRQPDPTIRQWLICAEDDGIVGGKLSGQTYTRIVTLLPGSVALGSGIGLPALPGCRVRIPPGLPDLPGGIAAAVRPVPLVGAVPTDLFALRALAAAPFRIR